MIEESTTSYKQPSSKHPSSGESFHMSTLEAAMAAGDIIFDFFNRNSYVIIVDADARVVKTWDVPHLPFGLKPGDSVNEGTISYETVRINKRIAKRVSKEKSNFGFGYVGVGVPVTDSNGRLAGAITITSPVVNQDIIEEISQKLSSGIEQSTAATNDIANSAATLATTTETLSENISKVQENLGVIADVARLIQNVAAQTNLLGLNAAIEAARAGTHGSGFSGVANEIRKLADFVKNNIGDIRARLTSISQSVESMAPNMMSLSSLAHEQAASTEEITAVMERLEAHSHQLEGLTKETWF